MRPIDLLRGVTTGPLDTTVRLKYPLSQYPALTTRSALNDLLSTFGMIDEPSIVISMKPAKKMPHKPPKYATALIPFRNIGDALAAVCASKNERKGLKDIEISWAEGNEPAVLEVLKRQGRVNSEEIEHLITPMSPSQAEFASKRTFVPGATASSAPSFVRVSSFMQGCY